MNSTAHEAINAINAVLTLFAIYRVYLIGKLAKRDADERADSKQLHREVDTYRASPDRAARVRFLHSFGHLQENEGSGSEGHRVGPGSALGH